MIHFKTIFEWRKKVFFKRTVSIIRSGMILTIRIYFVRFFRGYPFAKIKIKEKKIHLRRSEKNQSFSLEVKSANSNSLFSTHSERAACTKNKSALLLCIQTEDACRLGFKECENENKTFGKTALTQSFKNFLTHFYFVNKQI